MSFLKYTIFSLFCVSVLIYNLLWGHFVPLGIGFTLIFFIFFSWFIGEKFWPHEKFIPKTLFGVLAISSGAIILFSITYYLCKIDALVISVYLFITPIIIGLLSKFVGAKKAIMPPVDAQKIIKPKIGFIFFFLNILIFTAFVFLFYIIGTARTDNSIVSPWETVNNLIFPIYFLSIFFVLSAVYLKIKETYNFLLIAVIFFAHFCVALIIYKLGYGFDSFIHRAAENYIGQNGEIQPKSPYYIGQYVFVVFLAKLLTVKIEWIDKLLLPIFSSIFMPIAAVWSLGRIFNKKVAPLLALLILAIPWTNFIVTTPYGLSMAILTVTVFFGINYLVNGRPTFIIILSLALTTFFVHPITGLPTLLFALALLTFRKIKTNRLFEISSAIVFFILSALSVPVAMVIFSRINDAAPVVWQWNFSLIAPDLFKRFNFILDFAYSYKMNIGYFLIIFAVLGLACANKKRAAKMPALGIIFFAGLFTSYLILKNFAVFPLLGEGENQNYAERLLEISLIFLLPATFFVFERALSNLQNTDWKIRIAFFTVLAGIITASFYLTYPRRDIYEISHGWSVGKNHLEAVDFIENDAKDEPYIVLADQTTSAAALQKFGFTNFKNNEGRHLKTAKGEIFYYPLPLGGKLYQYYLDIIYKNDGKKSLVDAIKFSDQKTGYFVLNKYWNNYEKIKYDFANQGLSLKEIDSQTSIVKIKIDSIN
jgi:hypothetical protein